MQLQRCLDLFDHHSQLMILSVQQNYINLKSNLEKFSLPIEICFSKNFLVAHHVNVFIGF
jgi:hypothetical protein